MLKKNSIRLSLQAIFILTLILISSLASIPISEAKTIAAVFSPSNTTVALNTTKDLSVTLILKNLSFVDLSFTCDLLPFTAAETESGEITYKIDQNKSEIYKTLFSEIIFFAGKTQTNTFTIPPQQEQTITLQGTLEKTQTNTDYYFSIVCISKANNNDSSSESATFLDTGIASNIVLSLGTRHISELHIEEFSTPAFSDQGPIPFTIRASNRGKRITKAAATLVITNVLGHNVASFDLPSLSVLQGSTRNLTLSQIATKDNKAHQQTGVWNGKNIIGAYTARLTVKDTTTGQKQAAISHFFAIPIKSIVFLLIGLFLVVLTVKRTKTHLR